MPRTRRMRSDDMKLKDGWTDLENWTFLHFLQLECKPNNLKDLEELTASCKRVAGKMTERFDRRFSLQSMKWKLEKMRKRLEDFNNFMDIPGVSFDPFTCKCTTDKKYWQLISANDEPEVFRDLRKNGEPNYLLLKYLFDEDRVGSFPKDLTGSPMFPIDLRDSDEDELAVVLLDEKQVSPVKFDEDGECSGAGPVAEECSTTGKGDADELGMFSPLGLWEID